MNETTSRDKGPSCPYCGGKQFFHSRRSGLKDWILCHVLLQKPYRCAACDERFFHTSFRHRREREHHHI
jgi:DNA-directed RNA polymerase subunit RPC12/RpoP